MIPGRCDGRREEVVRWEGGVEGLGCGSCTRDNQVWLGTDDLLGSLRWKRVQIWVYNVVGIVVAEIVVSVSILFRDGFPFPGGFPLRSTWWKR